MDIDPNNANNMETNRIDMNKSMETILKFFFKHQIELKLYHFQSNSYGGHKASDKYLTKFLDKVDTLMEILQGHVGKINLQNISINAYQSNDQTINSILEKYIRDLEVFERSFKKYSDIQNIIQEMKADASQLIYLLTFK